MLTVFRKWLSVIGLTVLLCRWWRVAMLSFHGKKRLTDTPGADPLPVSSLHRGDSWTCSSPPVAVKERPNKYMHVLPDIWATESRPAGNCLQIFGYILKKNTPSCSKPQWVGFSVTSVKFNANQRNFAGIIQKDNVRTLHSTKPRKQQELDIVNLSSYRSLLWK